MKIEVFGKFGVGGSESGGVGALGSELGGWSRGDWGWSQGFGVGGLRLGALELGSGFEVRRVGSGGCSWFEITLKVL